MSQPAVSQNIAILEQAVGDALFIRNRGSVELTASGRLFATYADRINWWYGKLNAVMVEKTEKPADGTEVDLGGGHRLLIKVLPDNKNQK